MLRALFLTGAGLAKKTRTTRTGTTSRNFGFQMRTRTQTATARPIQALRVRVSSRAAPAASAPAPQRRRAFSLPEEEHGQGQRHEQDEQSGLGHVVAHESLDPLAGRGPEEKMIEGVEDARGGRSEDGVVGPADVTEAAEGHVGDGDHEIEGQLAAVTEADRRVDREGRRHEGQRRIDEERDEERRRGENPLFLDEPDGPEDDRQEEEALGQADRDERKEKAEGQDWPGRAPQGRAGLTGPFQVVIGYDSSRKARG